MINSSNWMVVGMSWRGMSLVFLLLLGFSITSVDNYCKEPCGETRYQRFLRQHFNNPKTPGGKDYCDKMMDRKCMTNRKPPCTKCKEINSFIHAPKNMIIDVCDKAGTPYGNNMRVSNKPFSVTTCKNQGDPNKHPCRYQGSTATRKIVISCQDGLPVHLDKGIVVSN